MLTCRPFLSSFLPFAILFVRTLRYIKCGVPLLLLLLAPLWLPPSFLSLAHSPSPSLQNKSEKKERNEVRRAHSQVLFFWSLVPANLCTALLTIPLSSFSSSVARVIEHTKKRNALQKNKERMVLPLTFFFSILVLVCFSGRLSSSLVRASIELF
ncbi:MAG: hypothetical protein J3R72DRAFT_447781 [Linnemannia gamsii]|nr:MAG: hypothetical protein J3R72DRAFT_447781 [Linnemannia gamsii]